MKINVTKLIAYTPQNITINGKPAPMNISIKETTSSSPKTYYINLTEKNHD